MKTVKAKMKSYEDCNADHNYLSHANNGQNGDLDQNYHGEHCSDQPDQLFEE